MSRQNSLVVLLCAILVFCFACAAPGQTGAQPSQQQVRANPDPCGNVPERRQFDFWVGEWNVEGPAGTPPATSSIQLIENRCVVAENFTLGSYNGRSFSFYDPVSDKWRQTYVDTNGSSYSFVGAYREGAMRFEGEVHRNNGKTARVRMTLFNLGPAQVRQLGEVSNDGGQTWQVGFDFMYRRKQ